MTQGAGPPNLPAVESAAVRHMRVGLIGVLLTIGGTVALFLALDLLPPRQLTMAAGQPGSAYHALAVEYRRLLARDRIELRILESPGSVANAAALGTEADVAIVQGGVPLPEDSNALAAILLEPLFVFHRRDIDATDPLAWPQLRIAAGPEGSGTRAAVQGVLDALGDPLPSTALLPLGTAKAAEALRAGDIEAAIFVAPVTAPYLTEVLADPALGLARLRDLPALAARLPFVEVVEIPAAGFDYLNRLPPEAVELPAMVALLAARDGLHPALVERLVHAARRIHRGPDLITPEGRFPAAEGLGPKLHPQAEALLRAEASVLDGLLPFWAVAQINRVAVLLLPLLFLLVPLIRALPSLYAWSMESRVYRYYDEVLAIDAAGEDSTDPEEIERLATRLAELDAIAREVRVTRRYRSNAYALRMHIDLVRRRLNARRAALAPQADGAGGRVTASGSAPA